MRKPIETAISLLGALMMLWLLVSWMDVVAHNDPYRGHSYRPWNAFVLLMEVME